MSRPCHLRANSLCNSHGTVCHGYYCPALQYSCLYRFFYMFLMTQPLSFIYSDCRIKTDLLFHDKITSPWNFPICIFIGTSWYSFVSISRQSCVYWHSLAAQRWSFPVHTFVRASTGGRNVSFVQKICPHLRGVWNVFLCSQRDKALKNLPNPTDSPVVPPSGQF